MTNTASACSVSQSRRNSEKGSAWSWPATTSSLFSTTPHPRRSARTFIRGATWRALVISILWRSEIWRGYCELFSGKLYVGLQDPDFNYTIRTAPAEYAGVKYFHWYLSIIPRLTRVAGFELGSGMFINTVLPEAAAEFLRNVKLARAAGA